MKINFSLFILTIVLLTSLTFAAHIIKTSTGTTSYSTDEIIQTRYNISINNTNAGQLANITSVNITLPSAFTFTLGTNGTSVTKSTFANISNVLSWTNATGYIINGSERKFFWFNATATPGTYNIIVKTTNITNSYTSNISVVVNDTTAPTATFGTNPTNTLSTPNRTITFNLKCNDTYAVNDIVLWGNWSGNWAANKTNSSSNNNGIWNTAITLTADGTFKWAVFCNDSAGNGDWTNTNRTFTVRANPTATFGTVPINTYNSSSANVVFGLKCSDAHNVNTMQLWGNWSGSWAINSTNSSGLANNTFSNISVTNLADGTYKWAVYCNDSDSNSDWTDINRTLIIDTTNPTASASCIPRDLRNGESTTCTCSGTDATSGVSTRTANSVIDTVSLSGTQTYTCTVTDYAGNTASATTTYIVTDGGGSSSSSGGTSTTFWTAGTHTVTNEQFANSFTKEISVKQRLKLNVGSQEHHVGLTATTATTATIEIASDPQTATLLIGDERKFEVTDDNYYDIFVKLNSITNDKANITIQSINELITEQTITEEETKENTAITTEEKQTSSPRAYFWTTGIIAAIVIIVLTIIYPKRKSKK